jgi:antitoxin (DNA-binding transcriptional repressor) of toxin-antitoxin stability system
MNTLGARELRRRGLAAIEQALAKGPVRILKRNRPVAIVLTEHKFQRPVASGSRAVAGQADNQAEPEPMSAYDFLLSLPPGNRSIQDIRRQIGEERTSWGPA